MYAQLGMETLPEERRLGLHRCAKFPIELELENKLIALTETRTRNITYILLNLEFQSFRSSVKSS